MHKLNLTLILVSTCFYLIQAQQLPSFSQYREHISVINPAAIHTDYLIFKYPTSLGASYQKQWVDVPKSPSTQLVRADYYTAGSNGISFGGHILNDVAGPTNYLGLHGRISGRIGWMDSEKSKLTSVSVGINLGAIQYRIDGTEISFLESGDFLENGSESLWMPDVGFGIFAYRKWKKNRNLLYAGFSAPQTFNVKKKFQNQNSQLAIERNPHYYGIIGYLHALNAFSFVESTIWARHVRGIWHLDTNIKLQIDHLLWFGVGLDNHESFLFELGTIVNGRKQNSKNIMKISYAIRFNASIAAIQLGTSHEVNLIQLLN